MAQDIPLPDGWRWTTVGELAQNIQYGYTESATDEPTHDRNHGPDLAARAPSEGTDDRNHQPHEPVHALNGSGGRYHPQGIDKSTLAISAPRRIRDKEHLKAVAAQPCIVCGRSPSHAHHLTFVQPKARGLKVSDEWVVPVCYLHHRELHDRGNEQEWWKAKSIDPVSAAESLWATVNAPKKTAHY